MRNAVSVVVVGAVMILALSACSARTKAALEEQRLNGAHFASWRHMGYSINRGTPQTTTKADIETSQRDKCLPNQDCKWWGEVVMVEPIQ
ncbi:MAG TPA: hypothetical protein VLH58_01250 [Candidatus Methylomirabilis sp.]|nr:hypothetical protein [Candidatus Methylomirabilis sp.]